MTRKVLIRFFVLVFVLLQIGINAEARRAGDTGLDLYVIANGFPSHTSSRLDACIGDELTFYAYNGIDGEMKVYMDGALLDPQPALTVVDGGLSFTITPSTTNNFEIKVRNCVADTGDSDPCDGDDDSNVLLFDGKAIPTVSWDASTHSHLLTDGLIALNDLVTNSGGSTVEFSGYGVSDDGAGNYYFNTGVGVGSYDLEAITTKNGCSSSVSAATFNVTNADPVLYYIDNDGQYRQNDSGSAYQACTGDQARFAIYNGDYSNLKVYVNGSQQSPTLTEIGDYIYFDGTLSGTGSLEIYIDNCDGSCTGAEASNTIYLDIVDLPSLSFTSTTHNYNVGDAAVTLNATTVTETPTGGTLEFSGNYVTYDGTNYTFNPVVSGTYTITASYTVGGCTETATQDFVVSDGISLYLINDDGQLAQNTDSNPVEICVGGEVKLAATNIPASGFKLFASSSTSSDDNELTPLNTTVEGDYTYFSYTTSTGYTGDIHFFVTYSSKTSNNVYFNKNSAPTAEFNSGITTSYYTTDSDILLDNLVTAGSSGTSTFSGNGVYKSGSSYYFAPSQVAGSAVVTYTFTDGTSGCVVEDTQTFTVTNPGGNPELYILRNDVLIANSAGSSEDYCSGDDITLVVINGNTTDSKLFKDGVEQSDVPQAISGGVTFNLNISTIDDFNFYVMNCNDDITTTDDVDNCVDETPSNTVYVTINDIPLVTWNGDLATTYSNADSEINLNNNINVPTGGTVTFSGSGVYQVGDFFYFYPSAVGNHTVTATYTSDTGCPNSATITFSVYDANASVSIPDLEANYCVTSIGTLTLDVILSEAFAFEQSDYNSYTTECKRRTTYSRVVNTLYLRDNTGGIHYFTGGTWNSTTKKFEGASLDVSALNLDAENNYYLYIEYTRTYTYDYQSQAGYSCSYTSSSYNNTFTRYVDYFYMKPQPTVDIVLNDGTSTGAVATDYCIREADHFIYPVLNGTQESYDPSLWQFQLININTGGSESAYIEGNKVLFSTLPAGDYEINTTYSGNSFLCNTTATSSQFSIIGEPVVVVTDTTDSAAPIDATAGFEYCEGESRRTWVVNVDGSDVTFTDLTGFSVDPDPGTSPLVLDNGTLYFYPDSLEAGFNYSFTYGFTTASCNWAESWNVFINPTPTPSFSGLVKEYCLDESDVVLSPLSGFDGGEFTLRDEALNTIEVVSTDSVFTTRNGLTYFRPGLLEVGEYSMIYTFQDENGCPGISDPQYFTIREPASAGFSYENVCLGDTLTLTPDAIDSTGYSFRWVFGDGTFTEETIGKKLITTDQSLFVTLYVTDDLGCVSDSSITVDTYPLPVSDFTAYGFCAGYTTTFDATDAYTQNQSDGLEVNSYHWDFGDGAIETSIEPVITHTYAGAGAVDVTLTLQTEQGCEGTFTKKYFIYPVVNANAYFEAFESYDETVTGWVNSSVVEDGVSSWQLAYSDSTGFVWQSNGSDGIYANNEQSYIESPCFEVSGLTDPMLALDTWRDTDSGADGAVMVYSVDGGLNWKLLGDTEMGINWYNDENILGVPGGDINDSKRMGWTGTDSTWIRSRLGLTDVLNDGAADTLYNGTFRLRVAFGSNGDNPNISFDGFGFDNIYIGNKNRKVIVEHFAEMNKPVAVSDAASVATYGDTHNDIIHVQYAIPNGSSTNVIRDGSQSARAYYYGIPEGPVSVIDGRYMDLHSSFMDWGEEKYSQESLIAAPYDLNVSYSGGTAGEPLAVTIDILRNDQQEAVGTVVGPVYVHAMVVKNSEIIDGQDLRNVFVAALPDAGGTRIEGDWLEGSARSETISLEYYPEENIGAGEYSMIVFIQSGDNFGELNQYNRPVYEVHQAVKQVIGQPLETAVISGVEDKVNNGVLNLYPVPADDRLVLDFGSWLEENISYQLIDNLGRILMEGTVRRGADTEEINVSNLQNGTYQVWIKQDGKRPVMEQLLILR